MTTWRVNVPPPPPPDLLERLTPPGARTNVERGHDPLGRERVVLLVSHDDPEEVARTREAWTRALRAEGYRVYLV